MIDILKNITNLMAEKIRIEKYWILGSFLLLAILMWVSVIFFGNSRYADEYDHISQINSFEQGDYAIMAKLTTIPGYHIVIAFIAKIFIHPDTREFRLISLAIALISIWVFYLLAKKIQVDNPRIRTIQYIFLPISFFYFPLVYTDIFSLLLILAAFYWALSKKYSVSALFSLAALAVRQNNIIWVAFFWFYTYVSENGFSFSGKKIINHMRKGAGYLGVAILFAAFVWFNNGISIGDREMQQVGFHMGNIYFFLALTGVLFLPVTISAIYKINLAIFKKSILPGLIIGAIIACLFLFFPPAIHEYNLKMKFLRNIILSFAYHQYAWSYALAIFFGCLTIVMMEFNRKALILIPFLVACLVPSLLIEQRYMIIPMVFMLLFRKEMSLKAEYANAFYFILISSGLIYMLLKTKIFF